MTNPLQLRKFDPEFLVNFQKGLAELLGLDGTDALPSLFKLPMAVALCQSQSKSGPDRGVKRGHCV